MSNEHDLKPTCDVCGSHEVEAEANLEWNVKRQRWDIKQLPAPRICYCPSCHAWNVIEWKIIKWERQANGTFKEVV